MMTENVRIAFYLSWLDCGSRVKLQEPQPSNHCPRKNGYFKHETDCNKFWQCVNGKPFQNECPHSLAFNEENGNCDWSSTCVSATKSRPDGLNEFVCPQEPDEKDFGNYPEPRYVFKILNLIKLLNFFSP